MSILKIIFESILNLLKYIYNLKVKIVKTIFTLALGFFLVLLTLSFRNWLDVRTQVKLNLDKYKSEVSNYYDSTGSKPIQIYDKNEKLIGEFYRRNFKPIRTDNLDDHKVLVWALLSSEDRTFFSHSGVNYMAILRAVVINIWKRKLTQGGSTITQQLAKLSLDLGERNVFHKLTELFCTYYIEKQYDKKTILAMYMNQIFMGEGNIGLEEASRYYYNKTATALTPAEASLLVGVIPAPSVFNPVRGLKTALERQKRVMNDMSQHPDLHFNKSEIEKDFSKKINENIRVFKNTYKIKEIKKDEKIAFGSDIGKYGFDRDFKINLAPEFNEAIRKYILEHFSNEELERTSLKIYTTLDYNKQALLQQALRDIIEEVKKDLSKEKEIFAKKNLPKEIKRQSEIMDAMNGSAISVDPYNGHVEALIGAYKISNIFRLNRAEEIKRQPGSVIKGLIYALALEKKIITPSTIIKDEKINFGGYSPKNWYGNFKGNITVRFALAQSVNTAAVKILSEVGVGYFLDKLSLILGKSKDELKDRFGNNLSLALGSGELSPVELNQIYSVLANGGYKVSQKKILRIVDDEGNERTPIDILQTEPPVQVLDSVACAMAMNMLESVLTKEGTLYTKLKDKLPIAGKTGTVQTPLSVKVKWGNRKGIRDSWFVGAFPSNVTTIWIGNDSGAPFPGSGAGLSGQIWLKYISYFKNSLNMNEPLVKPFEGDYIQIDTCADTGGLLQDFPECKIPLYSQYYYRGTEPEPKSKPPEINVENFSEEVKNTQDGVTFEEEKVDKYEKQAEEIFNKDDEKLLDQ